MKIQFIFLPFLALLTGAIGTLAGTNLEGSSWLTALGWGAAVAIIVLWVLLDLAGFKRLFTKKGAKFGLSSGVLAVVGLAIIIGIANLTSRPRFNKTYDATRDSLNTLSDQSIKTVDQLKVANAQVKLLGFFQDPEVEKKFRELLSLYLELGAPLAVEYVDPSVDPLRAKAENITSGNTAIFRLDSREYRVTTFNEEKVTNAFVNVMKEGSKKIYFTTGHGEGELRGMDANAYNNIVTELEASKFEVAELQLLEQAKVPDDADAVVVAGPRYDFKTEEARILEDYLKSGGAVLVLVDALLPADNLNRFMEKFGVKVNSDIIVLSPTDNRAVYFGRNNAIVSEFDEFSPVTREFSKGNEVVVLLQNTRSLATVEDNAYDMKVLLAAKTSPDMTRLDGVTKESDLANVNEAEAEVGQFPVLAVANGLPTAAATAENKAVNSDQKSDVDTSPKAASKEDAEIRLVVAGSSQFATNAGMTYAEHRDLFLNIINYLSQDEDFISIRPKEATKSTLSMTDGTALALLGALCLVYPFVFLGGGIVFWARRKNA